MQVIRQYYVRLYQGVTTYSNVWSGLLLAASMLLYLFVWGRFHVQVAQARTQPPEVDDAYTYLWQAARIPDCLAPCAALADINAVAAEPAENTVIQNTRARMNARVMTLYAPLQALGLRIVQGVTGFTPAQVFYVLIGFGVVLQTISLAYLLTVLWGRTAAAVALTLITLSIQAGQGLHYVVPSNITLMLAFILWARVLQHGRQAWRALLVGVIVLSLSHTLGRVYAMFAVALYIFSGSWRLKRHEIMVIAAAVVLVGIYWFIAVTFRSPAIDPSERLYVDPNNIPYLTVVGSQALRLVELVAGSASRLSLMGEPVAALCLCIALLTLTPERRRRLGRYALVLIPMALAMVLYVIPGYLHEGMNRVYPIVNLTLWYGVIGWLLVIPAAALGRLLQRSILTGRFFLMPDAASVRLWVTALWVFLLVNSSAVIVGIWSDGVPIVLAAREGQKIRQNYVLKPEIIEAVLSEIQPGDSILYYSQYGSFIRTARGEFPGEVALEYALTVGTYRYGLVYPPMLNSTQADKIKETDYLIGVHPVMHGLGAIAFQEQQRLTVTTPEPVSPADLEVYIVGGTDPFRLELTIGGQKQTLEVAPHFTGWLKFPDVPDAPVQRMVLQAVDAPKNSQLQGLRFTPSDGYWWAWSQKATLTYRLNDAATSLTFDVAALVPEGNADEVNITLLDDSPGYLLTARLDWK